VRIQLLYPGGCEVHLMAPNGSSQALGQFDASTKPSYNALDQLINAGRAAKLEIFDVARAASRLELERGGGKQEETSVSSDFHSREEIEQMDLSKLRRVLVNLGLPTSGSITKLQARALAVADTIEAGGDLDLGIEAAKQLR
jgi:hypothetical protein